TPPRTPVAPVNTQTLPARPKSGRYLPASLIGFLSVHRRHAPLPGLTLGTDGSEAEHAVLGVAQGVITGSSDLAPHDSCHRDQQGLVSGKLRDVPQLVRVGRQVVELTAVETVEHVLVVAAPDDALGVAEPLPMDL